MASLKFTDEQLRGMLVAVGEREGKWQGMDPNTEIVSVGSGLGLSEDESYGLFKSLLEGGYIDPGRVFGAGGAMPGHTVRVVGRGNNLTSIGDDVRLTGKGRAEIG